MNAAGQNWFERCRGLGGAFALALVLRWTAAWLSHGEPVVDVDSFWQWGRRLDAGYNPYVRPAELDRSAMDARRWLESEELDHRAWLAQANYPPLWVYLCWFCVRWAEWTGLSFDLFIKLLAGTFDAATVLAIALIVRAYAFGEGAALDAAWLYAVNPVPILIASYQGQNDPIVIGLVVWACWFLVARPCRGWWVWSMLAVACSLAVKPVALLYLPLLVLQLPAWPQRLAAAVVAMTPPLLLWLPYLLDSPADVVDALTSYRGPPDFGLLGILNGWRNLGHGAAGVIMDYDLGSWYRPMCVVVLALVAWRFRARVLVQQLLCLTLALYLVYARLGAQYLMWVIPFGACIGGGQLVRVTGWAGLALLAFYQLHHPAILSGFHGERLSMGVTLPQWSGLSLVAQVFLYLSWFRWLRDSLAR